MLNKIKVSWKDFNHCAENTDQCIKQFIFDYKKGATMQKLGTVGKGRTVVLNNEFYQTGYKYNSGWVELYKQGTALKCSIEKEVEVVSESKETEDIHNIESSKLSPDCIAKLLELVNNSPDTMSPYMQLCLREVLTHYDIFALIKST